MAAFRIYAPSHSVLIIAPGAFLPTVRLESLASFWRKIGGQSGWNRHLNAGAIRCPDTVRYDPTSRQVLAFERDELQRLRLVVNPAVPLGLVHTSGTNDLWRDMRRLFDHRDDADAAAADALRMMRQVEHVQRAFG